MNNKANKYISVLIIILIGVIMYAGMSFGSNAYFTDNQKIRINEGWNITVNNQDFTNVNLNEFSFPSISQANEITMDTTLTGQSVKNSVLIINVPLCAFEVYLDDEIIYKYGFNYLTNYNLMGYGYHSIDLPSEYYDVNLKIVLTAGENSPFSTLEAPTICNAKYAMYNYLVNNRVPLFINSAFLIFGLCSLCITIVFMLTSTNTLKALAISLFSIFIGIWGLCNYNFYFLFTSNLRAKVFIECFCLFASPVVLMLYFLEDMIATENKIYRKLYSYAFAAHGALLVISSVMQFLNVAHLPVFIKFEHIVILISCTLLIYTLASSIVHDESNSYTLLFGSSVLLIICVLNVTKFDTGKSSASDVNTIYSYLSIGLLLFLVSLVIDLFNRMSYTAYQDTKALTINKVSDKDPATKLSNRYAFEQYLDEIDKQHCKFAVIQFDLNNLKSVNDNFGYNVGDELIINFAKHLSTIFSPYGLVARIGGDEFSVVIKNTDNIDFKLLNYELNKLISAENMKHPSWKMSSARGIYISTIGDPISARQAVKIADERMYANKAKHKQASSTN